MSAANRRVVQIFVPSLAIEDGATPPPAVGALGEYPLVFSEPLSAGVLGAQTFRVRVEPVGGGTPGRGRNWDGTYRTDAPRWPLVVHGDGWAAMWRSRRPVLGHVQLEGLLDTELFTAGDEGVRGRITRVQVVRETIDRTDPDSRAWRVIPELRELRDVDVSPGGFHRGSVTRPDASEPAPGESYRMESGVLVTLDLDDVPPPPARPVFVPGALAVHGRDVWVADADLPLLVHLHDGVVVGHLTWAGGIQTGRVDLHADANGCWITGRDGVWRADLRGKLHQFGADAVNVAAASADGATMAVDVLLDPAKVHSPRELRLIGLDGTVRAVPTPGISVRSITAHGSRFLLLCTETDSEDRPPDWDGRPWPAWLNLDAHLTHGPRLAQTLSGYHPLTGSEPALIAHDNGLLAVAPDLTLRGRHARTILDAWAALGRLWVATHLPDVTSPSGWEPLNGPPELGDNRQHWLLTELDPTTLRYRMATLVPEVPHDLGVDDDGTTWVLADGVRHCPVGTGATAEPYDLLALLTRPDAAPPAPPGWGDLWAHH